MVMMFEDDDVIVSLRRCACAKCAVRLDAML